MIEVEKEELDDREEASDRAARFSKLSESSSSEVVLEVMEGR